MSERSIHAFLPRPLFAMAGHVLEGVLNRVVALDADMAEGLQALDGRSVYFHLRGPELALAITVRDGHLKVLPPDDEAGATLRVSTSPGGMLGMLMRGGNAGVAPGKVDIAGDAELARQLEKLARGYAPDIEAAFARRFGDVLGVPMARTLEKILSHVRDSGRHFADDSADWLREEARLAVSGAEMDGFLDEVDVLRERAERLKARIDRLAARGKDAPT